MARNRLCISEIIKIRVADTATLILFNLLIHIKLRGTPHSPHSQPHGYPPNQEPNHPHHTPHNLPRNPTNLLTLRHSILAEHVAAVSQAHCIVNLERMVERSLEAVQILVLRLAPLNLAER